VSPLLFELNDEFEWILMMYRLEDADEDECEEELRSTIVLYSLRSREEAFDAWSFFEFHP